MTYNGVVDYANLSKDFYWFSKSFSELVTGQSLEKLKEYVELINLSPAISSDYKKYCLFSSLLADNIPQKTVNEMIDNYYSYYQEKDKFINLQTHLLTLTNQKRKRTISSIAKMQQQIDREANCDNYRLYGDLIMANLYNNSDYTDKITLFDYENNQNITIELDSTKTLKENANKFYKQYNKGKTSRQKLSEMVEELLQTKSYLEQIEYSLNKSKTYEDLLEIKPELVEEQNSKPTKHNANTPEKIEKGEFTIYIGKNNRQNDFIVSKLAKDDDLWFHTKDCAGSHVLLKGDKPENSLILECAKLAKEYSSASKSSKVGVIYTKRKYLKKPPKANLGYVTYSHEQEIIID